MDTTVYLVFALAIGAIVLIIIGLWYSSRRQKNFARCWRCGKTINKEQLIWLKAAGDWTCLDCDKVIKMYINIQ
jgi:hypothetical protein